MNEKKNRIIIGIIWYHIKKFITYNPLYKLISLILALFIWIQATGDIIRVQNYSIKINYLNLPKDHILLASRSDKEIVITVKGKIKDLLKFNFSNKFYNVDLSKYSRGINEISLDNFKMDISTHSNIEILSINKNYIKFYFDKVISKKVLVKLCTINELPDNIVLEKKRFEIIPEYVVIRGTEEDIKNKSIIETENLDLSKINQSTSIKLKLNNSDDISAIPSEVLVNIFVKKLVEKEIVKPIKVNLKAKNYTIIDYSPKEVKIKLCVASELSEYIDEKKIKILANIDYPYEGENYIKLKVNGIPSYVNKYRLSFDECRINLIKK